MPLVTRIKGVVLPAGRRGAKGKEQRHLCAFTVAFANTCVVDILTEAMIGHVGQRNGLDPFWSHGSKPGPRLDLSPRSGVRRGLTSRVLSSILSRHESLPAVSGFQYTAFARSTLEDCCLESAQEI